MQSTAVLAEDDGIYSAIHLLGLELGKANVKK